MPRPRPVPASWRARVATSSPLWAAVRMSSKSLSGVRLVRAPSRVASATVRRMPGRAATVSTQPRLPQAHCLPLGSMQQCPTSPPMPVLPQ